MRNHWPGNFDMPAGAVASWLFPFTLKLGDASSSFSNFYFKFSGLHALLVSLFINHYDLFYFKKS